MTTDHYINNSINCRCAASATQHSTHCTHSYTLHALHKLCNIGQVHSFFSHRSHYSLVIIFTSFSWELQNSRSQLLNYTKNGLDHKEIKQRGTFPG